MTMLTTKPQPYDLESIFEWLKGKARPAIRLHPRLDKRIARNTSKVGGDFLWPPDKPWPHCQQHDSDHIPVLQVRSEDVPIIDFPLGTDLLQILWCPNDHIEHVYCPELSIFWRKRTALKIFASSRLSIKTEYPEYLPNECRLNPEMVQEYPSAWSLSGSQIAELDRWQNRGSIIYQYSLSVAPGFKMGGYPSWVQDPRVPVCSCGRDMDYLLTIASAEFDGGTYERWLPKSERRVWNAKYEVRNRVQRAAGLMLGDMGNINVFVCKRCAPWKHDWVFQCS
jgi:hypothetical protein